MIKKYILYLLRWQLSSVILAPVISFIRSGSFSFGSVLDWKAAILANFIGGCVFFWVDKLIFTFKSTKNKQADVTILDVVLDYMSDSDFLVSLASNMREDVLLELGFSRGSLIKLFSFYYVALMDMSRELQSKNITSKIDSAQMCNHFDLLLDHIWFLLNLFIFLSSLDKSLPLSVCQKYIDSFKSTLAQIKAVNLEFCNVYSVSSSALTLEGVEVF